MRPYDRVWSPVPISMEFYAPPGRTAADRRGRSSRGRDRGGVLCRARPRLRPGPGRCPLDGDGVRAVHRDGAGVRTRQDGDRSHDRRRRRPHGGQGEVRNRGGRHHRPGALGPGRERGAADRLDHQGDDRACRHPGGRPESAGHRAQGGDRLRRQVLRERGRPDTRPEVHCRRAAARRRMRPTLSPVPTALACPRSSPR
jgi:hypothetical protein